MSDQENTLRLMFKMRLGGMVDDVLGVFSTVHGDVALCRDHRLQYEEEEKLIGTTGRPITRDSILLCHECLWSMGYVRDDDRVNEERIAAIIAQAQEIVGGNAQVSYEPEQGALAVAWDVAQLGMNYRADAASARKTREELITTMVGGLYPIVFTSGA